MWENDYSSVTGASLFGSSQTHTFSVAVTELSVFLNAPLRSCVLQRAEEHELRPRIVESEELLSGHRV